MSKTYDNVNYITSFGFSKRWRRKFVNSIPITEGFIVADLLTGMGECWEFSLEKIGSSGKIIALDFSEGMLQHAVQRKERLRASNIEILHEDVFNSSIVESSVDAVVCGFGIKTFSQHQVETLVDEITRILKPGGVISMIDISVPESIFLKAIYMFYLKKIIPVLGALFLGRPETYAMLGRYTERFQNSKNIYATFQKRGFELEYLKYFFGCATGVKGIKV